MAIWVECDTAAEDDFHGLLDAVVGQGQGPMGFLGEGFDGGLELGMLEDLIKTQWCLHCATSPSWRGRWRWPRSHCASGP
jgi:hypothetical protein